jgi:DNA polymerase beta
MDFKDTILSALETMRLHELRSTDPSARFKVIAYNKAIANLRGLTHPICSVEDVKGVPGVGPKIALKIEEIIATGRLAAADRASAAPDSRSMDVLLKVHGIGAVKARQLLESGIRDIPGLRSACVRNPGLLNNIQKMGLRHYEDGCLRIPRAEIVEHEKRISDSVSSGLKWTIAGSYRRGAETSGDIDVLISHDTCDDEDNPCLEFKNTVKCMEKAGYIVDTLAKGDTKWMGYVRLRPDLPARRLDMMLVSPEEYPFAILYFTGSDKFNMAMRGYCHTIGYTLNEHRLAATEPGRRTPPRMKSEMDIFEFLGLQYIPPTERIDSRQIIQKSTTVVVGGAGASIKSV